MNDSSRPANQVCAYVPGAGLKSEGIAWHSFVLDILLHMSCDIKALEPDLVEGSLRRVRDSDDPKASNMGDVYVSLSIA